MNNNTRNIPFVEARPFAALVTDRFEAALICGRNPNTFLVWKRNNLMPRDMAEKIATAKGLDPRDVLATWDAGFDDLPDVRLPFAPIQRFYGTLGAIARKIGLRHAAYETEWADGLPLDIADKAATKVGLHPSQVWDNWFELALTGDANGTAEQLGASCAA